MVKHLASTKAQKAAKSCFWKEEQFYADDGRNLLQNPKGLHCNSPMGTCQRLQTASLPVTDASSTIGSTGSYSSMAEQPAKQPGPVAVFSCSGPYSKLAASWVTCKLDQHKTPKWTTCCLQNPNRPTRCCASLWSQGSQIQQLTFYLRRSISTCPAVLLEISLR